MSGAERRTEARTTTDVARVAFGRGGTGRTHCMTHSRSMTMTLYGCTYSQTM